MSNDARPPEAAPRAGYPDPRDVTIARLREALKVTFTNEVIRAIGALARQANVCREQDGKAVFVTGMEAAREYIAEQFDAALTAIQEPES